MTAPTSASAEAVAARQAATRQAATDLRDLLRALGADEGVVQQVAPWSDLGEHGHVHVPSLPTELVAHLVRLLPTAARS